MTIEEIEKLNSDLTRKAQIETNSRKKESEKNSQHHSEFKGEIQVRANSIISFGNMVPLRNGKPISSGVVSGTLSIQG